jgi:hypothetical protein
VIPVQVLLIAATVAGAQPVPTTVRSDPSIAYTLTINPADRSGFHVTMGISGAPETWLSAVPAR